MLVIDERTELINKILNSATPPVVPPALLRKRTKLFCVRIALAISIMAGAAACMMSGSPLLFVIGVIIQGAMYVHLIEFQHSVLHLQVFESHRITRLIGFLLGLPMMISFSDFQYKHLRHHKFLGTKLNTETFNYRRDQLNSLSGFAHAVFDYSRLKTLLVQISRAFSGKTMVTTPEGEASNSLMNSRIRQEYQFFGLLLTCVMTYSVLSGNFWVPALWLIPLVVSEPVHFLLELPEHLGLPAHSNTNVFENTRTWGGSWFARWFTHYTNFHIAHHFQQLVPMDNLPELQKIIDRHIPDSSRSESYPGFYIQVLKGEITP